MILLYTAITLGATIAGAIAGLGGGVIIKPLLDMVGYHDASTIGFYSSIAVFVMCISSIVKQLRKGFSLQLKIVIYISIGSAIGGMIGSNIFQSITPYFEDNIVKVIQAGLLLITLVFILLYTLNKDKIKTYSITNPILVVLIGIFLGAISVFLGIGGGPLNVSLLILLFSFDIKQATVYSIATIFFSQLTKILTVAMSGEFLNYDLSFLPFICISAICGGYIGTILNQKLETKKIEKIYVVLILLLISLSIYNVINNL